MSEDREKPKWYAASAIFETVVQDQVDDVPLLVEERVYLVSSTDDDDAFDKAISFAKQEEDAEGEFPSVFHGKPSRSRFLGIRKLVSVRRHITDRAGPDQEVADGCEATFSFFEIRDRRQLSQLISGNAVELTYLKESRRDQD